MMSVDINITTKEIRRYNNMYFSFLSMNHLIHGQFPIRLKKVEN
jgi:hypothetical protein